MYINEDFSHEKELCSTSNFIWLEKNLKIEHTAYFVNKINSTFVYMILTKEFGKKPIICNYSQLNGIKYFVRKPLKKKTLKINFFLRCRICLHK